nr:MAG TPA: hypothetical protein [Caudoviricetes sp.]
MKINFLAHLKLINFWIMPSSMQTILLNLYLKIRRIENLSQKTSLNK